MEDQELRCTERLCKKFFRQFEFDLKLILNKLFLCIFREKIIHTGCQCIGEEIRVAALAFLELRPENSLNDVAYYATVVVVVQASTHAKIDVARVFVGVIQEVDVL